MRIPARPKGVPEEAKWVELQKEWQLGKSDTRGAIKRVAVPIGEWRYWRTDGSLSCVANFDVKGRQHGILERYHNDGTLASRGEWQNGSRHGHFVYIDSENETDEGYPGGSKTWRYEFDSDANWEEHNVRYYLKDGTECTSDGRPLSDAFDFDTVIGTAEPADFLNRYAKEIASVLDPELSARDAKGDPLALQELWGMTAPEIDAFVNTMVEGCDFVPATSRRTFENNIWESLIAHPWDNVSEEMAAAFMGAVKIGYFGDSDHAYSTIFQTRREEPAPNAVFLWDHDTYHIDEVLSLTLDEFAFRICVSTAFEKERLSKSAAKKAWKKIAGRCYVGWYASGGLNDEDGEEELDNADDAVDTGDFDSEGSEDDDDKSTEVKEEFAGSTPYKVELDPTNSIRGPFWRAQWIIELLQSDDRRNWSDIKECFRPSWNRALTEQRYESLKKSGNECLYATALYLLWRLFWFGYTERLQESCELYRSHPARIVRDLVVLLEEIIQGRRAIGDIKDILAVRDEFLSLDLSPEREEERSKEKEQNSAAESARVQVVSEEAEQLAQVGLSALLDRAWSSVSDVNAMAEFEKGARTIPGNEMQWKCFDWVRDFGYRRENSEEAGEAIDIGVWLGQTGCEVLQPFIWSSVHSEGPTQLASLVLPAIGKTKGALDSRLIGCCLNQLDAADEFHHTHELAVKLLSVMEVESAVPRLCKVFDDYFEELGRKTDFEARLATIPWEALLTTTAKALESLAHRAAAEHFPIARKSLSKLLDHSIREYQHTISAPALNALIAWGETDLLPQISRMLNENDTPVQVAALRGIETLAPKLNQNDLKAFVLMDFRNPADDDNAVTLMYYRAANAIKAVDSRLCEAESMTEALKEARQLGTYGNDLWNQWRIIECETVGKFSELDIDSMAHYLQSSNYEIREAAEAAYTVRGVKFEKQTPVTWPQVWNTAATSAPAAEVAKLLLNETAANISAPAAWLWENPDASAASGLCQAIERKLKMLQPIESGEHFPSECTWLLRALARHAQFAPCSDLISRCLMKETAEVAAGLIQEIDALPLSLAPQLLKLAVDNSGWQRHAIAQWALKHQNEKEVVAALKSTGTTAKKLKSWAN